MTQPSLFRSRGLPLTRALAFAGAVLGAWHGAAAQTGVITIPRSQALRASRAMDLAEQKVKALAKSAARLTAKWRDDLARAGRYHHALPFSLPSVVRFEGRDGRALFASSRGVGQGLNLVFDASGPRSFPALYRQLLEDVFAQAEGTMNAVFSQPSVGGDVHVRNFDADIGDRHAVAGGFFVPDNGSGEAEIRFPVYASQEAAAVNFVHCLLLAYLGPNSYAFDAFQEGLVRAATMRVVRTAGALPVGLDPEIVDLALENTYDVGTFYEWNNQRALGGSRFIAPNLIDTQLPPGGSLGGVYLLRYQMSGTAWQKVLAEYPSFIKTFNEQFHLDPSIGDDPQALIQLGQSVIDALSGGPNATVEGRPFAEWFKRQFILETADTRGVKLMTHPIPLPPEPGSSDFGVFLVQATLFETLANGHEVLLSGVSFPVFWSVFFDRIFPSAQEDRMDIAGAYGSVAPNLPDLHAGQPYRCAVDIPVQDRIARCYLPAGAVATGQNTTSRDFYGTVLGVPGGAGVSIRVRVTVGATVVDNIAVTNGAFGALIGTPEFLGYQRLRVEVIRTVSSVDTVVIDRRVNKGPGPLALDLRAGDGESTFIPFNGLSKGLSAVGFPVDPLDSLAGSVLGIPEADVLAARWNSSKARYEIYPDTGSIVGGHGYFVRLENANLAFSVTGRSHPGTAVAVALRPGWNLITAPLEETVPTARVTVIKAADFPKDFADALGVELGTEFFEFSPGAPDEATGAPETGTMTVATSFQPGKAYFVRVLAAEGVTLLFRPLNPASPSRAAAGLADAAVWKLRATLWDGPRLADVVIGQSVSASRGFDPREDSGLPPGPGGLQLVALAHEPSHVDMRRFRSPETYRLRAVGLRPGATYSLRLEPVWGALRRYNFREPDALFQRSWTGIRTYVFRARGAERTFEIRVDGSSW